MDYLKGKSTGNHRFSHEIWKFPVIFPLKQSIETMFTMIIFTFVDGLISHLVTRGHHLVRWVCNPVIYSVHAARHDGATLKGFHDSLLIMIDYDWWLWMIMDDYGWLWMIMDDYRFECEAPLVKINAVWWFQVKSRRTSAQFQSSVLPAIGSPIPGGWRLRCCLNAGKAGGFKTGLSDFQGSDA